jgi:hypothetical protein
MATETLSAAELRKKKILERGSERMAKVLGSYGQDAASGAHTDTLMYAASSPACFRNAMSSTGDLDTDSKTPSSGEPPVQDSTACAPSSAPSELKQPAAEVTSRSQPSDQHAMVTQAHRLSTIDETEPSPSEEDQRALVSAVEEVNMTLGSLLEAAAYQTQALRFLTATCVAVLAVAFSWQLPGLTLVLQVLVANTVLILTSAWTLARDPSSYKRVFEQIWIRRGKGHDWVFSIASSMTGIPISVYKVAYVMGWAMYCDSGCYLASVIICHALSGGEINPIVDPFTGIGQETPILYTDLP